MVFRHQGTVDKFVGDMVMALFGAPVDDPDHAEHAVAAAVEMVDELGQLNRNWRAEGKDPFDIGIGVNSGEMIAGNIGSSSIMSYTVIGDNVNLGSRLESLNKDLQDADYHQRRNPDAAQSGFTAPGPRGRHRQGQDKAGRDFRSSRSAPLVQDQRKAHEKAAIAIVGVVAATPAFAQFGKLGKITPARRASSRPEGRRTSPNRRNGSSGSA